MQSGKIWRGKKKGKKFGRINHRSNVIKLENKMSLAMDREVESRMLFRYSIAARCWSFFLGFYWCCAGSCYAPTIARINDGKKRLQFRRARWQSPLGDNTHQTSRIPSTLRDRSDVRFVLTLSNSDKLSELVHTFINIFFFLLISLFLFHLNRQPIKTFNYQKLTQIYKTQNLKTKTFFYNI